MAGATKKAIYEDTTIEEIELDSSELEELDKLAEETPKCGIAFLALLLKNLLDLPH